MTVTLSAGIPTPRHPIQLAGNHPSARVRTIRAVLALAGVTATVVPVGGTNRVRIECAREHSKTIQDALRAEEWHRTTAIIDDAGGVRLVYRDTRREATQ